MTISRTEVQASVGETEQDDSEKEDALTQAEAFGRTLDQREHDQVLRHRERFAEHAYGLTQAWVGFLIVITIAQIALKPIGLGLGEKEFITVFTTTTAAVFGFGILVGNFLFPKGGSGKKRQRGDS